MQLTAYTVFARQKPNSFSFLFYLEKVPSIVLVKNEFIFVSFLCVICQKALKYTQTFLCVFILQRNAFSIIIRKQLVQIAFNNKVKITAIQMFIVNYLSTQTLTKYFDISYDIRVALVPEDLIRYMSKPVQLKSFSKRIKKSPHSEFQLMRKLTIAAMLILYRQCYYESVQQFISSSSISDLDFIKDKRLKYVIQLEIQFLKQCALNKQIFQKIKTFRFPFEETLTFLNHSIKMIKGMFVIVQSVCYLGRFHRQKGKKALVNFVEVIGVQLKTIYSCIKHCITAILMKPYICLVSKSQRQSFKQTLVETMPFVNDKMTYFFMNKYFDTCLSIGVKLIRQKDLFGEMRQNYDKLTKKPTEIKESRQLLKSLSLHELVNSLQKSQRGKNLGDTNFWIQTQDLHNILNIESQMQQIELRQSRKRQEEDMMVISVESYYQMEGKEFEGKHEKQDNELKDTRTSMMESLGEEAEHDYKV